MVILNKFVVVVVGFKQAKDTSNSPHPSLKKVPFSASIGSHNPKHWYLRAFTNRDSSTKKVFLEKEVIPCESDELSQQLPSHTDPVLRNWDLLS